jgi:two-component system sensor histidine kinase QseC
LNELLQRLDLALARERRFIADAAHELRTPISAVKVHADNARLALLDEERHESQRLLARGVERVERLVSQLLSLSRTERSIGKDAFAKLSLDALVSNEVEELRALAASKSHVMNLVLDRADVFGDEFSLGLLVRNLVENAIRYTPEHGVVVVSTEQTGEQCVLTVEDSGPGIPKDLQGRVFDRFYRVIGSGAEGSGLGLSIVQETLEAHDGAITLGTSQCLNGLKVTVQLPSRGQQPR